ncbi:MAG: type III-B CRISPR module RAMP protein Cmr6 [Deltaproteobacteria bacterium]|nr:type III-B CRISPR module RAMP protein Cmr6 [Deltaproteobacteria bacterium]
MSPIPKFIKDAWEKAQKNPKEVNANLAFYRFFEMDQQTETKIKESKTKRGFNFMMKIELEKQCAHLFSRQAQQIVALQAQKGWEAAQWVQVTQSRLACGLGIPHPSENGLLLDRISGAPYLAGTGLKGMTLNMARAKLEGLDNEEHKKTKALIQAIFGSDPTDSSYESACKGRVHFFDAFPDVGTINGKKPFQTDIVNPHYGGYYSTGGKTPPADYLAPVPSFFLTVRQGVRFGFALAVQATRGGAEGEDLFTAKELLDTAKVWLQTALMELGAGGKTRVGYGLFGTPAEERGAK